MEISKLSNKYKVRRLDESDADEVYKLELGNPLYFEHCPPPPSKSGVIADMKMLPKGKTAEDKYYLGFFGGGLTAVLDLILRYPNDKTAFIGFFMMNEKYQGKGEGSRIISGCTEELARLGFEELRLAFAKGNPQSEAFWVKNGFERAGIEINKIDHTAVIMKRNIKNFRKPLDK